LLLLTLVIRAQTVVKRVIIVSWS